MTSAILFTHKNGDHKYEKQSLNLSSRAGVAEEPWITTTFSCKKRNKLLQATKVRKTMIIQ